ncbi:MAG: elongation factor P [Candidatus Saccharimonadales bacterium]
MEYSITDLKKGVLVEVGGKPYRVIDYAHSSMGRGGAVARTKLKNLQNGSMLSKTFKGNEKITAVSSTTIEAQYLYLDNDSAHFLRLDDYDQVSLAREVINDRDKYLKEDLEVSLLYIGDKLVDIELPIKVKYQVVESEPNIKGDSAGSISKGCVLETGLRIQVPLFIEKGDQLLIDTRNGSYVERLKKSS